MNLPRRSAVLGMALLALPFHPFWLDFEEVRRGWLWCLLGLLLLVRPALAAGRLRAADGWLLALVALAALQTLPLLGEGNLWRAGHRLLWWSALFCLVRIGRALPWQAWAEAAVPTAILLSAYGILQAFGLDPVAHYSTPDQPVATLGNLNVASEVVAVLSAASAAACAARPRPLCLLAVLLGGIYLGCNGSLSGQVALPVALLALLVRPGRWRVRLMPLWVCVLGAVLAMALEPLRPLPEAPPSERAFAPAATSPLGARPWIWESCLQMAAESPLLGQGPGQFAVRYPRYRSPEEIDLSSIGRRFPTRVGTAHNDYLEVLVEDGVPGLLLWLAFLLVLGRAAWRQDRAAVAPLLAFGALMAVRSPAYNAPAAAVALLVAGAAAGGRPVLRSKVAAAGTRALGLLFVLAGGTLVLGHTLAAPYQAQAARGELPRDPAPLDRALVWMPFAADLHFLRLQEYANQLPAREAWQRAQPHVRALRELVPYHPHEQAVVAELALAAGDRRTAQDILQRVLRIDPGEPTARLLLSTVQAGLQRPVLAIQVLYEGELSPGLLQALPDHLSQLAELARSLGDEEGARVYEAEHVLLRASEAVRRTDPADPRSLAEASRAVVAALDLFGRLGLLDDDARPWIIAAAHYLDLDQTEDVRRCGEYLTEHDLQISAWQRRLLGDLLRRLRGQPGWQGVGG